MFKDIVYLKFDYKIKDEIILEALSSFLSSIERRFMFTFSKNSKVKIGKSEFILLDNIKEQVDSICKKNLFSTIFPFSKKDILLSLDILSTEELENILLEYTIKDEKELKKGVTNEVKKLNISSLKKIKDYLFKLPDSSFKRVCELLKTEDKTLLLDYLNNDVITRNNRYVIIFIKKTIDKINNGQKIVNIKDICNEDIDTIKKKIEVLKPNVKEKFYMYFKIDLSGYVLLKEEEIKELKASISGTTKNLKPFFDNFIEYKNEEMSEEEFKEKVIEEITDTYMPLLQRRYGISLESLLVGNTTKEENRYITRVAIPVIKRRVLNRLLKYNVKVLK